MPLAKFDRGWANVQQLGTADKLRDRDEYFGVTLAFKVLLLSRIISLGCLLRMMSARVIYRTGGEKRLKRG